MTRHGDSSDPVTPADEYPNSNPTSPGSIDDDSEASTPLDPPSSSSDAPPSYSPASEPSRRVPSLRTVSDPQNSTMSPSSSVTGLLSTVRRPAPSANSLPLDIMQKARALQEQRMNMAARAASSTATMNMNMGGPAGGGLVGGMPSNLKLPGGMARPMPSSFPKSAPAVPGAKKPPSLSERRAMKLGSLSGSGSPSPTPTPRLQDLSNDEGKQPAVNGEGRGSKLSDFRNYIDADKGWITFDGAATITRTGVNFANGHTFSISLDEIEVLDELGKGNYGTVYKVKHARPKAPRFGQGLSKFKTSLAWQSSSETEDSSEGTSPTSTARSNGRTTSGVVMAMKEIRLELDEAKFTTILKELVILHECVSPYIIDFYGAFYQEGAVYMCIEYMDGGSIDKLYAGGITENVLRKITFATIVGLKTLKDDHNIIHRDVKPTNILVNTNGQVKICDFGVSGNLVASIAKTNIGCQSYMAPERISGGALAAGVAGGADGTYNVQSDIWSLGLTIIECAMGRYPYPPEVSSTIFSQLSAIVEGEPPNLPSEGYSAQAQDFVRCCLNKNPHKRHTYAMLLAHPWIKALGKPETIAENAEAEEAAADDELADATGSLSLNNPGGQIAEGDYEVADWVKGVLHRKKEGLLQDGGKKPALHAAPLDSLSPAASPMVEA
ncbi:kinase-like protein [Parathielavia appendiculata]|uniref:mitogen-activated protein kinase kinase n=1 Tax=Parathielavia appendiculata TaxID=2587402 RepID=A0AAN6U2G5_9PEZI|nr:kinase-like protein [Parathielavia appendiculata]